MSASGWVCGICGKNGDREAAGLDPKTRNEYWCYRGALGSLKGCLKCCNCALYHGDFTAAGYAGSCCKNCLMTSSLPEASVQEILWERDARSVRDKNMLATLSRKTKDTLKTANSKGNGCHAHRRPKVISEKQASALKVKVFTLDECIFRTPLRPKWWPFRSYEPMIESVCPPLVAQVPGDEYWNMEVVQEVISAMQDNATWTVMITFRTDAFTQRLTQMFAYMGLKFDEVRCRPICAACSPLGMTSTGEAGYMGLKGNIANAPETPQERHMTVVISDVLQSCKANELEIWTSSYSTSAVAPILKTSDHLSVSVHRVQNLRPHPGGTPSAEFLSKINHWTYPKLGAVQAPPPKATRNATPPGRKQTAIAQVKPMGNEKQPSARRPRRSYKPPARGIPPSLSRRGNSLTDPWSSDACIVGGAGRARTKNVMHKWLPHPRKAGGLQTPRSLQGSPAAAFENDQGQWLLETVLESYNSEDDEYCYENDDYVVDGDEDQYDEYGPYDPEEVSDDSAADAIVAVDEETEQQMLQFAMEQSLLTDCASESSWVETETGAWHFDDNHSVSSFSHISDAPTSDWDELDDFEVRSVASMDLASESSYASAVPPTPGAQGDKGSATPTLGYLTALLKSPTAREGQDSHIGTKESKGVGAQPPQALRAELTKDLEAGGKDMVAIKDENPDDFELVELCGAVRGVKGRKTRALRLSKKGRSRH
mmetsp:Transcript_20985/g.32890  ORF Transcript_20985/g.32890 Transcript_20985/m.32890 type:complete len:711 (-) Transcript_20985:106-2238(-)|eukprot:CAMPEP_0184313842 /NCGR_PEP_ID=MMETSP1049-20130417/68271_1 /TAXON_ID=77928 /ORGANISM="Proteomonas sulcata, Strain CCMP704" /LENGTH=710 /DNA_ID=CAMNT_0026631393 /DNA_START=149 /DNA_END=2281 /DNA_ORIENTATION=-